MLSSLLASDDDPATDPEWANLRLSELAARMGHAAPWGDGARVLVGCSGGADSVALLLLLDEWRRADTLDLHVAHVHHGIRGSEADADAERVRSLAEDLDLPWHLLQRTLSPRGAIGAAVSRRRRAPSATRRSRRLASRSAVSGSRWPTRPTTRRRRSCCSSSAARERAASRGCVAGTDTSPVRCSTSAVRSCGNTSSARARRGSRTDPTGTRAPHGPWCASSLADWRSSSRKAWSSGSARQRSVSATTRSGSKGSRTRRRNG